MEGFGYHKLKNMLDKELRTIKDIETLKERVPTDVLVVVRYQDGHVHCILPAPEIARVMANSLLGELAKPFNIGNKDSRGGP